METPAYLRECSQALRIPENHRQARKQRIIHVNKALDGAGRGKHRGKEPARVGLFTGHG
jgi:hypothetical protein